MLILMPEARPRHYVFSFEIFPSVKRQNSFNYSWITSDLRTVCTVDSEKLSWVLSQTISEDVMKMCCWFELLEVMMMSADPSVSMSQRDPVQVGQHRPGRPLQLQQVLHSHLGEGVAGVQLHDQPDHDGDQHDDLGEVTSTLRQAATVEAVQYCTREGGVKI